MTAHGFDAVDLDIIKRGDMLGSKLGERVFEALTAPGVVDGARAEANAGAWWYEIQYGPDGEANYAWVYDEKENLVCTAKLHHAITIVSALSGDNDPACTDCGGTGETHQTERRCSCQPHPHRTPTPEIEGLIGEMRAGLEGVTPFTDADVMRYDHGGARIAILRNGERRLVADTYHEADSEHFARCRPDNIAKLLAHISALEEELKAAREALTWYADLPKEWTINAGAGCTYGDLHLLGEKARAALSQPPVGERGWQDVASVLDKEEAALLEYRNERCVGDDPVKSHAWTVADGRLSEVGAIRRKLIEAGLLPASPCREG